VKKIDLQLFNMMGQELMHSRKNYQSGYFNTAELQSGVYILSITSDDGRYRLLQKIVKK
jgi:hypothetical protein